MTRLLLLNLGQTPGHSPPLWLSVLANCLCWVGFTVRQEKSTGQEIDFFLSEEDKLRCESHWVLLCQGETGHN